MALFPDWKRALWRAPLHILMSAPVAAASLIVPPAGKAYIAWREDAERQDFLAGRDSSEKATVDLYTQTALVRGVLKLYGIK
jgi:hypothetical protein